MFYLNMMVKEFMAYKDGKDRKYLKYIINQLKRETELPPEHQERDPAIEVVRAEI